MVFSKISQVAHYAPKQLVTNDDLANIMDTSHEWIFLEPELPKGILSERSSLVIWRVESQNNS